jgi:hypothetical protein
VTTIFLNTTMVGTPTQRVFARPVGFAHPQSDDAVANPIEFSIVSI